MSFPSHRRHERFDDAISDDTLARPQVGISRITSTLNRPKLSVNKAKVITNDKIVDRTTWRTSATSVRQVVRWRPRIVPSTWPSLTRRLNLRTHPQNRRIKGDTCWTAKIQSRMRVRQIHFRVPFSASVDIREALGGCLVLRAVVLLFEHIFF